MKNFSNRIISAALASMVVACIFSGILLKNAEAAGRVEAGKTQTVTITLQMGIKLPDGSTYTNTKVWPLDALGVGQHNGIWCIGGGHPALGGGKIPRYHILSYYDISMIPKGAKINSAYLSYFFFQPSSGDHNISVHRVEDPDNLGMWDVTSVTYSSRAGIYKGSSTPGRYWTKKPYAYPAGNIWAPGSGPAIMESIKSTATCSFEFGALPGDRWMTTGDVSADVQAWLDGTAVNQGWLLKASTPQNSGRFASNASVTEQFPTAQWQKPKLVISYSMSSAK